MRSRFLPSTSSAGVSAMAVLALSVAVGVSTSAPAHAAPVPSTGPVAAGSVQIPASCRAAVTMVRPDTTLAMGVLQGRKATSYSTGHRLGYVPKAIAYLGSSTNRGITIDRFLAVHPNGDLRRLTVTARAAAGGGTSVSLGDVRVGRGWGVIRTMVASGPYLYGLTTTGGFKRYAISNTYAISSAGTIATRGWGGVTSLAYGGWWKLPGDRQADDLVALISTGALKAYVVPRHAPGAVRSHTLKSGGWGMFRHVAAGECSTGPARPLLGVTKGGDVHAYLDANADDQRGGDIGSGSRVARNWTGLVAD